jgi:hypothetical protein
VAERPILMSAPMVRACLREVDPKTQTRRVVKPQAGKQAEWLTPSLLSKSPAAHIAIANPGGFGAQFEHPGGGPLGFVRCPYGVPGDVLWVKETCRAAPGWGVPVGPDCVGYPADGGFRAIENTAEAADRWVSLYHYDQKRRPRGSMVPSIHMPRWASRISLRITDVRVERLNAISREDALAEGLFAWTYPDCDGDPRLDGVLCEGAGFHWKEPEREHDGFGSPVAAYRDLWEHINGADSWVANPFVWAVSFERVT